MGPQSGSCGYWPAGTGARPRPVLQWVHSLVAVVIGGGHPRPTRRRPLQWVHSLVAVVIVLTGSSPTTGAALQWVHSLVAVVIAARLRVFDGVPRASMGPQSGSCGYGARPRRREGRPGASMGPQSGSCGYQGPGTPLPGPPQLQWVHSLVAVVIASWPASHAEGPDSFNGSTVW